MRMSSVLAALWMERLRTGSVNRDAGPHATQRDLRRNFAKSRLLLWRATVPQFFNIVYNIFGLFVGFTLGFHG